MQDTPEIAKIIKEIERLKRRGELGISEKLKDGKEVTPFWKQTFNIGGQEIKVQQEFIEEKLETAAY